jgi:hypothetical protein
MILGNAPEILLALLSDMLAVPERGSGGTILLSGQHDHAFDMERERIVRLLDKIRLPEQDNLSSVYPASPERAHNQDAIPLFQGGRHALPLHGDDEQQGADQQQGAATQQKKHPTSPQDHSVPGHINSLFSPDSPGGAPYL